ncbi:MAG: type II toxin-antitoxin system RelE/ParE family toxin [Symploca sp. SIO1C2]|nr:type II toxin-antitoxin system RelE/ParE family toxin [Symploca sp. SIO1C2]
MESKRVPASFYKTEAGNEPVRDWLKSLGADERRAIGNNIRTLEYGWPIGMPICKPLRRGLFEVRTNLQDRIARVIFCIHENNILLLHGFIKKTEKISDSDLSLALDRKQKLEQK